MKVFYVLKVDNEWDNISDDAKNLIKQMLNVDPKKRISAFEALNNPWITKYATVEKDNPSHTLSLKNLQSFKMKNQLQQAAMAYIGNYLQSQEKIDQLKKIFSDFDKNGDGVLDKEELIEGYIKLGNSREEAEAAVDEILEKIDINNNGTIDYSEFIMANINQEDALTNYKLKEAFKIFDKVIIALISRMKMVK